MKFSNYLNFPGTCAEAFAAYETIFGGKISFMQTFGDSPMKDHVPAEWQGAVMHATLDIAGETLGGSDAPPDRFQKPQGFYVAIALTDPAEAERIFAALAEGGSTDMPLQQTFWAKRFGMLSDRFGIPWMINCE